LSKLQAGRYEKIVLAYLLESSVNIEAIKLFCDSDSGKPANVGQGPMGEMHILEGETIATCTYLAEATTNPG
jgi:hypothetical protein